MLKPAALRRRARTLGPTTAVAAGLIAVALTAPAAGPVAAPGGSPDLPLASVQDTLVPLGGHSTHGELHAVGGNTKSLAASSYSLVSFGGDLARWDACQSAITYRVNARLAGSSKRARLAAIGDVKTAFSHVASATGMRFRYAGTTKQVPRGAWHKKQRSAEIVVAWTNNSRKGYRTDLVGGKSSGAGGTYFQNWVGSGTTTGAATRGYVVLNAKQNRMYRSGFGSGVTRGSLLLHEIGHVIGLNHVSRRSQVMYPTAQSRKATKYRSGDRAGLKRLGASAGCLNVPAKLGPDLS